MAVKRNFSDEEIMLLLQQGDEDAFTELYNRYWQRFFIIATHATQSASEAEEIVQDVFLRIWNKRESLDIITSVQHYLAVSIKYEIINRLRKQSRRERLLKTSGLDVITSVESTEQIIREKELMAELEQTIRSLPEKCQIVFRLSRQSGFSNHEIARELNISINTVESHLSRALRTMRCNFRRLMFFFT
jgi:RNA polymerase sigma-70 factor (ECF subfamily)